MSKPAPINYSTAEQRPHTRSRQRSTFGRSSVDITCPFCGETVMAYIWSLSGGGKRCPCGAMHTARGATYKNTTPTPSAT